MHLSLLSQPRYDISLQQNLEDFEKPHFFNTGNSLERIVLKAGGWEAPLFVLMQQMHLSNIVGL